MRVSVIVPCYNARPWLRETLDSVVQQNLPELEVIVVDDGSTDGSADFVSEQFPEVRLMTVLYPTNASDRVQLGEFVPVPAALAIAVGRQVGRRSE